MRTGDEISQKLSDLHTLYSEAEEALKYFETLNRKVSVPSVNQLRYAGFHILKGLVNDALSFDEGLKELDLALGHIKRALFDVYEHCALFSLDHIVKFNDDYRDIPVSPVIPDIVQVKGRVREIIEDLSRFKNRNEDRYLHFQSCRSHYKELEQVAYRLDSAREELNKIIEGKNRQKLYNIIMFLVALASLIIAVFK